MKCPACKNELTLHSPTGVKAHACQGGCGGLWVELSQIKKLQERNPGAGEELLHIERAEGVRVFRNVEHVCPQCETTLLYRHFFSKKHAMEIDQCAKCAGYWADTGILAGLFDDNISEEDRSARVEEYLKMVYQEKLSLMVINHETVECARHIVQMFRFLIPEKFQVVPPPMQLP